MTNTEMNNLRVQEILEKIEKNTKQKKVLKNFQFENQDLTEKNRLFIVHYFEQIKLQCE